MGYLSMEDDILDKVLTDKTNRAQQILNMKSLSGEKDFSDTKSNDALMEDLDIYLDRSLAALGRGADEISDSVIDAYEYVSDVPNKVGKFVVDNPVQASTMALQMAPGGSLLDSTTIMKDIDEKKYLDAGLKGLGAIGDMAYAVPLVGATVGSALKVPGAYNKAIKTYKLSKTPPTSKDSLFDIDAIDAWRSENKVSQRKESPNIKEAKDLLSGDITSKEFRKFVKDTNPIGPIKDVPKLPKDFEVIAALDEGKRKRGIIGVTRDIPQGEVVTSRLDIPAYNSFNVYVTSVIPSSTKGTVYGKTTVLKNVTLNTSTSKAAGVASGKGKSPFAVMEGEWQDIKPEDAIRMAKKAMDDPEWTQLGMNPARMSQFYNKATGEPVFELDDVIQIGALVLGKGIKKTKPSDLRKMKIQTPKGARMFYKGGLMSR